MQGPQNQSQPKIQEAEQDNDLVTLVAHTHDLFETSLGKQWLEAAEKWFLIRQGVMDPRAPNPEIYAGIREGQNMMLRSIRQWVKERKIALSVKAKNSEANVTPKPPKAHRAVRKPRGKK